MTSPLPNRAQRIALSIIFALSISSVIVVVKTLSLNLPLTNNLLFQNGKLLGGDFIAFYVGGSMIAEGEVQELYNFERQKEHRDRILGDARSGLDGEVPFVYPPLIAGALSFIAPMPFHVAFIVWTILGLTVSLASYLLFARTLWPNAPLVHLLGGIFLLGFIPYSMYTLLGGQLAWFGLSLIFLLYVCLRKDADLLAGVVLSLSYYKPPLFLVAALILLLGGGGRLRLGFALGAFLLIWSSWLLVGTEGILAYLQTVSRYTYGQKLIGEISLPTAQGKGIYALLTELAGSAIVSGVILLTLIIGAVAFMLRNMPSHRSGHVFDTWFASLMIASVSLSIQCIKYDLTLLIPSVMLIGAGMNTLSRQFKSIFALVTVALYYEWISDPLRNGNTTINLSSILLMIFLIVGAILLKSEYKNLTRSTS